MEYFTYQFDKTPCWAIATYIPEPQRNQGVHQILDGEPLKTTPLILYNDKDILKYLMIEKNNQPIVVKQLLGGIAIVDKATLLTALQSLHSWYEANTKPGIAFFKSEDDANDAIKKLLARKEIYYEALMEDLKPRVPNLRLEAINFNDYIRTSVAKYGEKNTMANLLKWIANSEKEQQPPEIKSKPSKRKIKIPFIK